MAVKNPMSVYEMAQRFAEVMQDEPAARALWFRQWGPVSEFWLVTEPIDVETARRLRQASRLLRRAYPGALIDFQILNPQLLGDTSPESLIPANAEQRPLH